MNDKFAKFILFAHLWPCLTVMPLRAQSFPVSVVEVNGPDDKRINIVFLSEGYTLSEMQKYLLDVDSVVDRLFATSPYQEYHSYFNVYAIEVPSNESGTDHPGTAVDEPPGLPTFTRDTYFNTHYDAGGLHRGLVPLDAMPIFMVLEANAPFWDIAFMIVNYPWYGGSGTGIAVMSTDSSSAEVAIHELGHAFASLADEYEYGGLWGYDAPNSTDHTLRDSVKWNAWIDSTTPVPTPEESGFAQAVGLFEGAARVATGWYRPKLECKMRTLGVPYCDICTQQSVLAMYELVNPIDSALPTDTLQLLCSNAARDFVVNTVPLDASTLRSQWFVNEQLSATGQDLFTFDASQYAPGEHMLKALVTDTTPLVKNDPTGLLLRFTQWHIKIGLATGDCQLDGRIDASDIIFIVNFVFKSGAAPIVCEARADVNCNGAVSSADIIHLVNHVFKGGAPPCDVCSLIPSQWTCD